MSSFSFRKVLVYNLILGGIGLKFAFFLGGPIWEDDWARFLWEGQLVNAGLSPYLWPPEFFFSNLSLGASELEILSRTNNPDWPSIYSPLLLSIFAFSQQYFPWTGLGIFLVYGFCDLGIFRILWTERQELALVYWIHPVFQKEIFANWHFEIVSLFFLMLALRKKHNPIWFGFLLGVAIHCKLFFLVFAICSFFTYRTIRSFSCFLFSLGIGFLLPYFLFQWGTGIFSMVQWVHVLRFWENFLFNPLGIFLLKSLPFPLPTREICMGLFLTIVLVFLIRFRKSVFSQEEEAKILGILFLLFLFLSPVANAWYFLPLLPLALLGKSHFLQASVWIPQISYATEVRWGNPTSGMYDLPSFVLWAEIILFIVAFVLFYKEFSFLLYNKSVKLNFSTNPNGSQEKIHSSQSSGAS